MRFKFFIFLVVLGIGIVAFMGTSYGALSFGQAAPVFTLSDLNNKTYDLSAMKDRSMIILYFFDVNSKPSQEGMLSLNQLSKQYKGSDLTVLSITLSPQVKAENFASVNHISFPILLDKSGVSKVYQAEVILPTVCIIGPGLKIMNYIQGGGKTSEIMMVSIAERELQRKQPKMAKAISKTVTKKNPRNTKARAVAGYASMKEGNLKEAEETFTELAQMDEDGGVLGKEGLAAVYVKGGQKEKAMKYIREVEEKNPERSYVYVVKGDLLYALNQKKDAEAEYRKAAGKLYAEPYQESDKYSKVGRVYASNGEYEKAREFYDKAIEVDPYDVEDTTNKGIAFEKEGNLEKAYETYKQASTMDKTDVFANVLLRKAEEMLTIQKDTERKKRMDQLVKDLAERYRSQKAAPPKVEDEWTSRPMVLTFLDLQEKGGLSERDGMSEVLIAQLTDSLNASGRVNVVERALMERLLEELNLGSSELASTETALKLGQVLAAKLIGTGSLYFMPNETTVNLRLIDTETSAIPRTTTKHLGSQAAFDKEIMNLNRDILKTVISQYPLRGYIAKMNNDQVIINLGTKQGVVMGTKFDVLEEQGSIEYKGKTLRSAAVPVAQLEIVRTEPDLSYAKIVSKERSVKVDDKVQERLEENVAK